MLTLQQIVNGLMLGGILAFVALGFTLTIGVLNFLNFTIPALFMLAAMTMWALSAEGRHPFGFGWHWLAAAAVGILVGVAASLLVERFTYPFMKVKYGDATEHALPLVSSLGFLMMFEHLVITLWGTEPQRLELHFAQTDLRAAGLVIGIPQLASLCLALVLVALLSMMLARTRVGRALRAIAENPDAATLMGIEVNRIVPLVFLLTGVLSALAGILYSVSYRTVSPYVGDSVAADAIAGMVLGGLGNAWGAVVGGLLVGMVKVLAISWFGAEIEKIPVWGLLLAILVFRPTGLFGHTRIGKGKF
jgi:branched-chain amino acid transport system permease protein